MATPLEQGHPRGVREAEAKRMDTKIQHTPGPWKLGDRNNVYASLDRRPWNRLVAEVNGTSDTAQANARLIAASPTLAEALQTIVKAVREGAWDDDGPNDGIPRTAIYYNDDMITVAINALRAAGITSEVSDAP